LIGIQVVFEWDEATRHSNVETHGVDFAFARLIFNGATLVSS
jgi:uncharacterized DUF497 family protein